MTAEQTTESPQAKRSNTALWLLILSFLVPMVAAYAYFFLVDDYKLGNHGELIQPVVQIEMLNISNENGELKPRDELIHIWKMILVTDGVCEKNCQQSLYHMRQINTALGKNSKRFKHALLHTEPMSEQLTALVTKEYQDAEHNFAPMQTLKQVLPGLDTQDGINAIYVMDPLGNVMMRFPFGTSPKLILKDLKRLLKISRIG